LDYPKSLQLSETIRQVILTDFAQVMESRESTIGTFIMIAVGIEFLGACLDKQHMNASARSEKRFNMAIVQLFPKKYHHFAKQGSVPYLYSDFRCPVIHQFKAGKSIALCNATDANDFNYKHLEYNTEEALVLVAENFFRDLAAAGQELIRRIEG
jgi:hypothetical protein